MALPFFGIHLQAWGNKDNAESSGLVDATPWHNFEAKHNIFNFGMQHVQS
jgi:hypothetical protein